jgi:uncharacterized protein (DUF1501 family)
MNTFTRRSLVQAGLSAAPLISVGTGTLPVFLSRTARAAEAPAKGEKILVVIQLLGGNDGLNTVVPHKIDGYARGRRGLRIPAGGLVKLSDEIGLHPSLKPMEKALENNRLAVVQGVGYPNPDRSHFRSMDIWESARLDPNDLATGWLGRAMDAAADRSDAQSRVNGLHVGVRNLPLALRARRVDIPSLERLDQLQIKGDNTLTRIAADVDRLRLAQTNSKAEPEMAAAVPDNPLLGFVARTTATAVASSKKLADLDRKPGSVKYPDSGLSSRLQLVARMIKSGLDTRVFYTSLDGFDTHANQLNVHAGLLGQLGGALAAFESDIAEAGQSDRVAVLVFSEFGRRLAENASLGTDHGAAAPVLMTGNLAKKGLVGAHPSMESKDLDDGDVTFHTDFRRIYADILANHLEIDPAAILGTGFAPLGLLG